MNRLIYPGGAGSLNVVVVEPYADAADSMAWLLELWGHRAAVAVDGRRALEACAADHPDVVLLELRLPDDDGRAVARRIRDAGLPGRPLIVALTSADGAEERHRSAEAGIDLHLLKPIDPAELWRVLARVVEGQSGVGPGSSAGLGRTPSSSSS